METEWQRRERKNRKRRDVTIMSIIRCKRLGQNEQIAQKVRSIIHKEEKVKNKDTRRTENEKRKVQKKRKIKKLERKEAETEAFNSKK